MVDYGESNGIKLTTITVSEQESMTSHKRYETDCASKI